MLFALVGAFGSSLLFISFLCLWVLVSVYALVFALRCYLVVVQATAAGMDAVEWPDEPLLDWILQMLPTLIMLAIWLLPVGLLARVLDPHWLPGQFWVRLAILGSGFFWLIWPVGLLSSLGSLAGWMPLSPRVLLGLLGQFPSLLLFYLVSAALLALVAALFYGGIFTPQGYLLPLAAVAAAAGVLIHARLVGRLGWLLSVQEDPERPALTGKPRRKRKKRPTEREDRQREDSDEEPVPHRLRKKLPDEEEEAYGLAEPEPEPDRDSAESGEEEPSEQLSPEALEREWRLRRREPPNPPPTFPLWSGVYTFPTYPTSLKALLWLSFWCLCSCFLLRLVIAFFPR